MHSRPQQIENARAVRPYHADWELPPNEVRIGKIVWSANYLVSSMVQLQIRGYTLLNDVAYFACVHMCARKEWNVC
jgi:hypothetical protein